MSPVHQSLAMQTMLSDFATPNPTNPRSQGWLAKKVTLVPQNMKIVRQLVSSSIQLLADAVTQAGKLVSDQQKHFSGSCNTLF